MCVLSVQVSLFIYSEMEMSHFSETMKDSAFKVNPLTAIGEHLRKRLKQEDEQS